MLKHFPFAQLGMFSIFMKCLCGTLNNKLNECINLCFLNLCPIQIALKMCYNNFSCNKNMFKSNHKNQKSFELFLSASMHFIFLNTRHFSLSITRRVRTFSITTTPPHRDSRFGRFQTLGNRCKCHGSSEMTIINGFPVSQ